MGVLILAKSLTNHTHDGVADPTADAAASGDITTPTHVYNDVTWTTPKAPPDVAALFARIAPRRKPGQRKK